MNFNPYPYQRTAIEWIIEHPCCGLLLDMGLGKTVITLTALQRLQDWCEIGKALVVAPKKVAEATWSAEASKWQHLAGMRVAVVLGSAKEREAALKVDADIYVTGRDNYVWLAGYYNGKLPFDAVVLDELTSFKNHRSQRWKAFKATRGCFRRIIGLTGTPAPNGLPDLWGQIFCLDGGERLGKSVTRFRDTYFNVFTRNGIMLSCTPKRGTQEALEGKLRDICLSMAAKDYLTLPPLTVHDVVVKLPEDVQQGYAAFERDRVLEWKAANGTAEEASVAVNAAALVNKLAQYANGAVYTEEGNAHPVHAAKLEALDELVEAAGEPVLVFYQFKHDAERITARMRAQKRCVRLYEKAKDLEDWNNGEIDVLLAHPAATAYGLNMQQGGRYIVWFGLGWNLELYQQANARLYRQGQQRCVHIYRLLALGTVDERAAAALEDKRGMQAALLDSLKALINRYE